MEKLNRMGYVFMVHLSRARIFINHASKTSTFKIKYSLLFLPCQIQVWVSILCNLKFSLQLYM